MTGLFFHIDWEWNNHPNWRTHVFQRGRSTTNQGCSFGFSRYTFQVVWREDSELGYPYPPIPQYIHYSMRSRPRSYLEFPNHLIDVIVSIQKSNVKSNDSNTKTRVTDDPHGIFGELHRPAQGQQNVTRSLDTAEMAERCWKEELIYRKSKGFVWSISFCLCMYVYIYIYIISYYIIYIYGM